MDEPQAVYLHVGRDPGWLTPRKTSFGPHWLRREIERCGPGDYLAVTSTHPLMKLKMLPEFLRLFQHTLNLGVWRDSDRVFRYHDGQTRVIFGSATNPEALESATAKAAWLDEVGQDDFRLESWEAILRRLSLFQGRVLGGTTIYNLGWLKQIVYEPWLNGDPDIDIIQFPSTDNPAFPRAEYERMERVLPAWKFNMFYRGQFTRPAGAIYGDFIDDYRESGGHKVHPFAIPSTWPRYGGVDFGATNTARLLVAHDPDADVFYVYDELLSGDQTTTEHARAATASIAGTNFVSWHGGAKGEVQQRRDWTAAGVSVMGPPFDDVEAGIDRVVELLKTKRIYFFDTCKGLLSEMGQYSREVDEMGQSLEKIKDKESYHRLDALRYVVLGVTTGSVRSLPSPWY